MHLAHPSRLRQHNYLYPEDLEDRQFSSPSPSPSLSVSLSLSPPYTTQAYTYTHSALDPSTYYDPSNGYYSDSSPPATPENYSGLDLDQYMASRSQNPPIRVQESTITPSVSQPASSPSLMYRYGPQDGLGSLDSRNLVTRMRQPAHRQELAQLDHQQFNKRLSLESSVGSTGPNSPYSQSSSYPPTLDQDSSSASSPRHETLDIGYSGAGQPPKPLFAEPNLAMQDSFLAPAFNDFNPMAHDPANMTAIEAAMSQAIAEEGKPVMGHQYSSVSRESFNSPYAALDDGRSRFFPEGRTAAVNLDQTIADGCHGELYDASMVNSAPVSQGHHTAEQTNLHSPYRTVFSERLQTANQNHMFARSASPITNMSRERSPFVPTSDYAVEKFSNSASTPHSPAARLNSASSMREKQKADISAREYQLSTMQRDQAPSSTISPKEAMLVYNEAEEDAKVPLFPQEKLQKRENQFASTNPNTRHLPRSDVDNTDTQRNYDNIRSRRRQNFSSSAPSSQSGPNYSFMSPSAPSAPNNVPMPQQYPFISNSRRQSSSVQSSSDSPVFPAQLSSMESTRSENGPPEMIGFTADTELPTPSPPSPPQRPTDTLAGSGSYACTSPGCSQRFDTSTKLQKHRREAHRATSPLPNPSTPTTSSRATTNAPGSSSSATANRNNQAGPHKCERTNPSTGKPCNTQFSRSYDLTRHEETIHNNRKMKVRCQFCTEEKTFSRNDALTRHMRVVHPDVDFPGKTKRRAG